jgi:deazaflavin-dependent oxidoreductase (nitroreductase family)
VAINRQSLERNFFRVLNRIVEPAVRKGVGSPRFAPAGLILLESTGFKTGATRSTPLLAFHLGPYVLVSTARGGESFWVKNLDRQPDTRYYLGGRARDARAFVLRPGKTYSRPTAMSATLGRVADYLAPLTGRGWAFALLETRK